LFVSSASLLQVAISHRLDYEYLCLVDLLLIVEKHGFQDFSCCRLCRFSHIN